MGLGSGLGELLSDNLDSTDNSLCQINVSEIEPDVNQPRKTFTKEAISSLADSIRDHGMLQPVILRHGPNGRYIIVAGERRWRAARMLGLDEIPAIIKEISESESAQIAIIENLQREDLNPVEEAEGYKRLCEVYGMSQEAVAKLTGKSRSTITNMIRILSLPDEIQAMLKENKLSFGHAKALLSIEDTREQYDAAYYASIGELTVRDIENIAKKLKEEDNNTNTVSTETLKQTFHKEIELSLKERLGRKVKVKPGKKKGSGTISLEFYSEDDLKHIADILSSQDL